MSEDKQPLVDSEDGEYSRIKAGSPSEDVGMDRRYLLLAVPLVISCCVYFATRSSNVLSAKPTLIKALVVFRHGSRAPGWTYATDKYSTHNSKLWPDGPDKLTKKGKEEAYQLGLRLRERYGEFLGSYYLPDEVRTYSTPMERTMMSGQLVLAGLYPPTGYQLWNEELQWQPIPVYPEYTFNSSVGAGCPKFGTEAKMNLLNEVMKKSPQSKETVSLVMKHAGEPDARPFEVFVRVWDSVYFQEKANLPVPEWLKEVYPEKMSHAAVTFLLAFIAGSDIQKKLVLYNYAHALRDFLLSNDRRKMELHSWHDINNMALMRTLGIEVDFYPEPTSCLIIEMHSRKGQKYFEAYFYDSYRSKEPRMLEMSCGLSCSEEDLLNLPLQYQLEDYHQVCNSVPKPKPNKLISQIPL